MGSYPRHRALIRAIGSYLLGESEDSELFKNPEMLKRFKDISEFSEQDKEYIIYTLDALIKSVKLKSIA